MGKRLGKLKIVIIAFLVVLLAAFMLKNVIISYVFEKYASEANRAKVDVDGLKLNLFKKTLTWDRLQVTDSSDTMKNLVDTGDLKVEIELMPLLKESIVINKFELSNVEFNTQREKDGKLPGVEPRKRLSTPMLDTLKSKLRESKKEIPLLNIDSFNSKEELEKLIEELDVQLLASYEENKKYITERRAYWENAISEEKYKKRAAELKKAVDSLKNELEDFSAEDALLINEKLEKISKLREDLNSEINSLKNEKEKFENEYAELKTRGENFSKTAKSDLLKLGAFKDVGSEVWKHIGEALFGGKLTDAIYKFVELAESYSAKQGEEGAKEKEETLYPKFWVKEGVIDLSYGGVSLKGDIKNLVDDNIKIDKESFVNIAGEEDGKKVGVDVILDSREELKEFALILENFSMSQDLRNYYLKTFAGSQFDLAQDIRIKSGILDMSTKLNFDHVDLKNIAEQVPIKNERIRDIYLTTLESAKGVEFDIDYKNNGEEFTFKTNIDNILAANITSGLSKEIEKFKSDLMSDVNSRVASFQGRIDSELMQYKNEVSNRIAGVEGELFQNVDSLEELKKGLMKKGVGDVLDVGTPMDIFKKLR